MTFKYSVLLKARFGGPFVLSENTRLLLYMPKWRFQSFLRCFLAYPHATCRKNECVKYIAFPYIADTLWNALLSPLYRVLFHTFHRVFHTIICRIMYIYTQLCFAVVWLFVLVSWTQLRISVEICPQPEIHTFETVEYSFTHLSWKSVFHISSEKVLHKTMTKTAVF